MSEIRKVFEYEGQEIRTLLIDDSPWFVATDVARVLGYRMASDMTRRIDDEDKGTRSVRTPSGDQTATIISEPGLYVAVLGSQVSGARAFKRWVTHEVLPTIRKTGSYQVEVSREERLALAVLDAQQMLAEKDERIAELEPAADAWAVVVSSKGSMSIRDAAKALHEHGVTSIGGNRLIKKYIEWGWCYRPYTADKDKTPAVRAKQSKIEQGVFVEKAKPYLDQETGERKLSSSPQVRVTGKGLDATRKRLIQEQGQLELEAAA